MPAASIRLKFRLRISWPSVSSLSVSLLRLAHLFHSLSLLSGFFFPLLPHSAWLCLQQLVEFSFTSAEVVKVTPVQSRGHTFFIHAFFCFCVHGLRKELRQLSGIAEAADKQAFLLIFTPKGHFNLPMPQNQARSWGLCAEETLASRALKPWTLLAARWQG